jgi:mono/diheme cytochrome c family protein
MWKNLFSSQEEPTEVVIPKGNPKRGKALYFEECAGCHTMFVRKIVYSG